MSNNDLPPKSIIVTRMMEKYKPDTNAAFPAVLHRMLTDIDELSKTDSDMAKLNTIVGWQDDGRSFKVHDRNKFISLLMPVFFCRLKYASFVRQLNTYNFQRISEKGPDKGALYHENFVRGMPELCVNIPKMKKRKGKQTNARASSPSTVSQDTEHQAPPPVTQPAEKQPVCIPQMNKGPVQVTPQYFPNDSLKTLIGISGMCPDMYMSDKVKGCKSSPSTVSLELEKQPPLPLTKPGELFSNGSLKDLIMAPKRSINPQLFMLEDPLDVAPITQVLKDNNAPINSSTQMDCFDHLFDDGALMERFLSMAHSYATQSDDLEPVPISPLLDGQLGVFP